MITDGLLRSIAQELIMLPRVWSAMRQRRCSFQRSLAYVLKRILAPEPQGSDTWRSSKPFVTPEGVRLYNRRDFVAYQELFLLDAYCSRLWGEHVRTTHAPIILDAGSNIGMFSTLCLTYNPSARLYCFDMIPDCCAVTRQRVADYPLCVGTVTNAALGVGDSPDAVEIHYNNPFAPGNSLFEANGARTAYVPRLALDEWVSRTLRDEPLTLLKIDVEGAEGEVVRGSPNTLRRAPFVLMELHGSRHVLQMMQATHDIVYDDPASGTTWNVVLKKRA